MFPAMYLGLSMLTCMQINFTLTLANVHTCVLGQTLITENAWNVLDLNGMILYSPYR